MFFNDTCIKNGFHKAWMENGVESSKINIYIVQHKVGSTCIHKTWNISRLDTVSLHSTQVKYW